MLYEEKTIKGVKWVRFLGCGEFKPVEGIDVDLKATLDNCVYLGTIYADLEELINEATHKMDNSDSLAECICWLAERDRLISERSTMIKEWLELTCAD